MIVHDRTRLTGLLKFFLNLANFFINLLLLDLTNFFLTLQNLSAKIQGHNKAEVIRFSPSWFLLKG